MMIRCAGLPFALFLYFLAQADSPAERFCPVHGQQPVQRVHFTMARRATKLPESETIQEMKRINALCLEPALPKFVDKPDMPDKKDIEMMKWQFQNDLQNIKKNMGQGSTSLSSEQEELQLAGDLSAEQSLATANAKGTAEP